MNASDKVIIGQNPVVCLLVVLFPAMEVVVVPNAFDIVRIPQKKLQLVRFFEGNTFIKEGKRRRENKKEREEWEECYFLKNLKSSLAVSIRG